MAAFRLRTCFLAPLVILMALATAGVTVADDVQTPVKSLADRPLPPPVKGKHSLPGANTVGSHPGNDQTTAGANCGAFVFSSPRVLPPGQAMQAYLFRFATRGGTDPISFAVVPPSRLPAGLTLDPAGTLAGHPQTAGAFSFIVTASDGCPQGARRIQDRFRLDVREAATQGTMLHVTVPTGSEEAAAQQNGLSVGPVTLRFENGPSSLTVAPNAPLPGVVAHLGVEGRGAIAGYWVIPGNRRIPFQSQVRAPEALLRLPEEVRLPTADPGVHEIRLVLAAPREAAFPGAVARYVVMGQTLPPKRYVDRQVVVAVSSDKASAIIPRLTAAYDLRLLESHDLASIAQSLLVFEGEDVEALVEALGAESEVLLAQPNHVFHTLAEPQSAMQSLARKLDFTTLHSRSRGRGVTVAVVDTGVDLTHEDLRENIRGAENFIPQEPYRAEIHGTAVAGIIAAGLNETGIAGVAPEAKILALRACRQVSQASPLGRGDSVSIARAVDAALKRNAGVVNMSLGSEVQDRLLARLIEAGARRGILFVAPVGNREERTEPSFPASLERVIAVGGIGENGRVYPNQALAEAAAVCAPCEHLFTTIPGGRYNFLDGTSLSAAVVSGLLALALETRESLRPEEIPRGCGDSRAWTQTLLGIAQKED